MKYAILWKNNEKHKKYFFRKLEPFSEKKTILLNKNIKLFFDRGEIERDKIIY